MTRLREVFLKPVNLPVPIFLLVFLFLEIPNWAGQVEFWSRLAEKKTPNIAPFISGLESPLARFALLGCGILWLVVTYRMELGRRPKLRIFELQQRSADGNMFVVIPIRNDSTVAGLSRARALVKLSRLFGVDPYFVHLPVWLEWPEPDAEGFIGPSETKHLVLAAVMANEQYASTYEWQAAPPRKPGADDWMLGGPWPAYQLGGIEIPRGPWNATVTVSGIDFSKTFRTKIVVDAAGIRQR